VSIRETLPGGSPTIPVGILNPSGWHCGLADVVIVALTVEGLREFQIRVGKFARHLVDRTKGFIKQAQYTFYFGGPSEGLLT
jgi:hypothetical protein